MRTITSSFCIALAFGLTLASTTWGQEKATPPNEIDALVKQRAILRGQLEEAVRKEKEQAAIATLDKMVSVQRQIVALRRADSSEQGQKNSRAATAELLAILEAVGVGALEGEQFSKAHVARQEVVDLLRQLHGPDDYRVGDAERAVKHVKLVEGLTPDERKELQRAEADNDAMLAKYQAGQFADATRLAMSELAIFEKVLGKEHPRTAVSYYNLAQTYKAQGDYARAEPLYQNALAIEERVLGREHPDTALSYDNLAKFYWAQFEEAERKGQAQEAIVPLEKMVIVQRQIVALRRTDPSEQGQKHAQSATAELVTLLGRLGDQALGAEQLSKAHDAQQAVVDLLRQLHGPNDYRVGDAERAVSHVKLLERLTPDQRREVQQAVVQNRAAVAKYQAGQFVEAMRLQMSAIEIRERVLGKEHADTATSYYNMALLYEAQRDFAQAEPLIQKALAIEERVLGKEHPDTATSYSNLARMYQAQGDYVRAEPLYQKASEIKERVLGKEHPSAAGSYTDLAKVYLDQGNSARAEPLFKKALAIREKVLGKEHSDTAFSYLNLAALYQFRRDFAQAEPLLQKALAIMEKALGTEHPNTATSYNNLAMFYEAQGDFARAKPLLQKALAIQEKVLGKEHPDMATSYNNLAGLYEAQGDYERAEPLYQKALAIREKALGNEHPDTAQACNNLALFYYRTGDYARAEPLYQTALTIRGKVLGKEHPETANSYHNLAALYEAQGDYERAEPLNQKALTIREKVLGENHPDTGSTYNNLAGLYCSMGDFARAEPLLKKALAIVEKAAGMEHPNTASSYSNLAGLYKSQGEFARAKPLYEKALAIREKVLGKEHPDTGSSYNNLAMFYDSQGDFAQAERLLQQALAIWRKVLGEEHPHTATASNNLAELYNAQGDYARAEPLARSAVTNSMQLLERTAAAQTERQQFVMTGHLRGMLDRYLAIVSSQPKRDPQAYEPVLAWKGIVFTRQRVQRSLSGRKELQPLWSQLQSVTARWAQFSLGVPDPEQRDIWRRQLDELEVEKERLERELSAQSAQYRAAREPVTLEKVRAALPDDAVLVDLLEYTRHLSRNKDVQQVRWERQVVAFVVRRDAPVELLNLGPVAPLGQAINTWRQTWGLSKEAQAAGQLLREKVWQPLGPHLKGAKTVLISPDGVLGRFPILALPGKEPGTYLLEERAIVLLPVPQVLPTLLANQAEKEPPSLLLVGGVDYGADPGGQTHHRIAARGGAESWGYLKGTANEAAAIETTFGKSQTGGSVKRLAAAEATESAFRDLAPQSGYLHLATHGFFAPPSVRSALAMRRDSGVLRMDEGENRFTGFNPGLLSGIVLAGANQPRQPDRDDGILTAAEVEQLDLTGVDLAVLSACETGLGEAAGGEGLLGLQRAFQVAGCRSVVASLWQVDDEATQQLTVRFYDNLWQKKMSKLDALREAQLWMLREGVKQGFRDQRGDKRLDKAPLPAGARTSPYFWAAFVLSGDWR